MNIRQRGTMPQRYPARPGELAAGQAGIRTPSMKASLARSAVANQSANRSVRPRTGRPISAITSRLKPNPRPKVKTKMTANPMNRPAR